MTNMQRIIRQLLMYDDLLLDASEFAEFCQIVEQNFQHDGEMGIGEATKMTT